MSVVLPILPIVLATVLYLWQSGSYYFGPYRLGMTLTFIGYAIANIGLVIDFYEMNK
jgi:hypothetical protein